jgi:LacI family transcriptional regulator
VAATIVDVARLAGVSTATVSRVLSGTGAARPATRERVLAAVRDLDYAPSAVARALKRRETRTIGLLVTDIANPFFPQVVRAVEDEAHARGYGVVLGNAADDPERELAYLDLLLGRRVDGLIVASARATARHAARLARVPMPVVLVNSDAAEAAALPGIATDHRRGAQLGAEHLVGLGHRRIAYVGVPAHLATASAERIAGVHDALVAAGLDRNDLVVVEGDGRVDGAERAIAPLLGRPDRPTGVLGFNDLAAIGVLRAARAAGLRVPDDVSVVGFDDIEPASWTDPPLTTVRQPTDALGRWAVTRIADALASTEPMPAEPPRRILVPTLVVRGSSGPPQGTV